MKILDLPLKKEWYNMIESGEKKEEYREIKPYWTKRLINNEYTHVRFRYGYTKRTMIFEINHITTGIGKQELGAPEHDVYIIRFSLLKCPFFQPFSEMPYFANCHNIKCLYYLHFRRNQKVTKM